MHAVLGVLIGLGGGYTIGEIVGAILGGVILGIFGYSMGTQKAFRKRLTNNALAQSILICFFSMFPGNRASMSSTVFALGSSVNR